MAKTELKTKIRKRQNGKSALSDTSLPAETRLFDTDRIVPKADGGTYTDENTRAVDPVDHMVRHGNLRLRADALEELKEILDDREQTRKVQLKIGNQLLAYERRVDHLHPLTREWLQSQKDGMDAAVATRTRRLEKWVLEHGKDDALMGAALQVDGIGPVTVAYCTAYIDLEKAAHASSLWAYAGLDKASHERYTKGVKGGGNKTLRTVLYTMAESQMKSRGAYRGVYDQVRQRLEVSEKITKSRNTAGQLIECAWKDTKPCHRHGAALRAVMKHFLADYWFVGRELAGLPTAPLYAEAVLGGHRTVSPRERGWTW